MRGETRSADGVGGRDGTRFGLGGVEVAGDPQAGLGFGRTKKIEDPLIGVQRFARPVFGPVTRSTECCREREWETTPNESVVLNRQSEKVT
jgi:hypothetical protein